MKKNQLILGGLILATAGYFGYRYFKKKKAEKPAPLPSPEPLPQPKKEPIYEGPTEYQRKVMKLQATVGAAVDGIPGPNTNLSVKNYFPVSFAKLGNVSSANIDSYIALGSKREQAPPTSEEIAANIDQAVSLLKAGKLAIVKEAAGVDVVIFDELTKRWTVVGANDIKAGTKGNYYSYQGYSGTSLIFRFSADAFYRASGGSRNVRIALSNLIFQ